MAQWGIVLVALVVVIGGIVAVMRTRRRSALVEAEAPLDALRRRRSGETLVSPDGPLSAAAEPVARPRVPVGLSPWRPDQEVDDQVSEAPPLRMIATVDEVTTRGETAEETGDGSGLGDSFFIPRGVVEEVAQPIHDADAPEPRPVEQILSQKKKAHEDSGDQAPPSVVVPAEIEENVSVVLRRQIPIAAGAPRSWFGGLPRMPGSVEWPHAIAPGHADAGAVPLNFLAQIACADLPADLWGGLGPRAGWLLFFLNPRDEEGDDPRLVRVLHIDAIGETRAAPNNLPPVDADTGPGPDYRHCRTAADIPVLWRYWPIDLIPYDNRIFDDGNRIGATPPDFAADLYENAKVVAEPPNAEADAPLSWRGALYVVDSVLRELDDGVIALPPSASQCEVLRREGYVAAIIPELRLQEEAWAETSAARIGGDDVPSPRDLERRERAARLAAERQDSLEKVAAFIVQNPNAEAIIARCAHDRQREADWRHNAVAGLVAVRSQIMAQPLDASFAQADWEALRAHLDSERFIGWSIQWASRNSEFPVTLVQQSLSLLDLAEPGRDAAVAGLAADYQADPKLAPLVPDWLRSRLEPHWRALTDNRPHRMGGYHDGLQTDPVEGPQEELLLLQVASDAAMHWMWGDGGAYFLTITPRDLANGRFDRVQVRLELP